MMLMCMDKNSLLALNKISGVYSLIEKHIVRDSIIQMKDEKTTGLSGLVADGKANR